MTDPLLDPTPSDPAAVLASIERQEAVTRAQLTPRTSVLFAPWGLAWLVAAVVLFLAAREPALLSLAVALAVTGVAVVAAVAVSAVHSVRRTGAVEGPSRVEGAILGNAFFGGSVLAALIVWRFAMKGLDEGAVVTLAMVLLCSVFGLLTLASQAVHRDRTALVFGILLVVTALACLAVPYPANVLVLGVLGGGGMLAIAAADRGGPSR